MNKPAATTTPARVVRPIQLEEPATTQAQAAARDRLQCFDTATLLAAARGEVDLNALARGELANRGLGLAGQWVGFPKAAAVWGV